jgi:hypothetical protein
MRIFLEITHGYGVAYNMDGFRAMHALSRRCKVALGKSDCLLQFIRLWTRDPDSDRNEDCRTDGQGGQGATFGKIREYGRYPQVVTSIKTD